ncbi:MAG: tRNA (adenosine(37)-N6)-threonylcarbamoyltransferase complex transferase subunit TsaD [Candidatus Micrarchaeia archaeon]
MICLGIESTAHTLGVGICELQGGKRTRGGGIRVLANEKSMYRPPAGQGILPRAAADHHGENFLPVLARAMASAGIALRDVDLFSFSQGPGIGQCLRVSCTGAKYLALKCGKPIVGVNHCAAHLEISRGLLGMRDPLYVYVSGANTQLIAGNSAGARKGRADGLARGARGYSVLGETMDMGLGNLFDVFAREAGFAYPHGSEVARLAEKGRYFPLPYTVKGMNFAFAGLLTSAVREVGRKRAEDICHSLMETAFAEICEASERALCLTGKKEMAVCGGVAQNARFCEMLSIVASEHGARFGVAAPEYNADNGAMIAYLGIVQQARGRKKGISSLAPNGYWRIDEVA